MLSSSKPVPRMCPTSSMLPMAMKDWAWPSQSRMPTSKRSRLKFKEDILSSLQVRQYQKSNSSNWRTAKSTTYSDINQLTSPYTGTPSSKESSSSTKSAVPPEQNSLQSKISSTSHRVSSILWVCTPLRWRTTKRCLQDSAQMGQISYSKFSSYQPVRSIDAYSKLTKKAWIFLKFNLFNLSRFRWEKIAWKKWRYWLNSTKESNLAHTKQTDIWQWSTSTSEIEINWY